MTIETREQGQEPLLTMREVASLLRMKPRTVATYTKAGRIPAIRYNARVVRYHWPSVLRAAQGLRGRA